uniref:G protein-coupled receptor n=1 Tax=Ditylenchus dipsaci TaxID=166011 RepID=A0A915CT41_9BILA
MNQRSGLPSIVHYFFGTLHFLVPVVGLNVFRFETSSALPLWAMSICDCICLMAQFAQATFHVFVKFRGDRITAKNSHTAALFCKIDLYLIHTTSAFSVWCWLVLSVMSSGQLQPQYLSCYENTEINATMSQTAHLMDIFLSYVVPAFIRILLDGIVLFYCYRPNIVEVPVIERRFGISAPSPSDAPPELSESLRAMWTLEGGEQLIPAKYLLVLEGISQLLYFGQFTCNAFYLSTTIYETSTIPMRPLAMPCVIRRNRKPSTPKSAPPSLSSDLHQLIIK